MFSYDCLVNLRDWCEIEKNTLLISDKGIQRSEMVRYQKVKKDNEVMMSGILESMKKIKWWWVEYCSKDGMEFQINKVFSWKKISKEPIIPDKNILIFVRKRERIIFSWKRWSFPKISLNLFILKSIIFFLKCKYVKQWKWKSEKDQNILLTSDKHIHWREVVRYQKVNKGKKWWSVNYWNKQRQ